MTASRKKHRSAGSGTFHCPSCHEDREYELLVEIRQPRFLGLPVGRSREGDRRVVCGSCGTRFAPDILFGDSERLAQRVEATLRQALRGLIVRMVLEDGRVAAEEEAVLIRVYQKLLGHRLDADELAAEVDRAAGDRRTAEEFAQDLAPLLSPKEKATVLRAALQVARADHDYDPRERQLLAEIGAGLELSSDAIRAVLNG